MIIALDRDAAEQLGVQPVEVFAEQDAELASLDRVTAGRYDDGTWVGTEYTFDRESTSTS